MEVEEFAFDFTHQGSAYSVNVKRFAVEKQLHLDAGAPAQGGWADIHLFTRVQPPTRCGGMPRTTNAMTWWSWSPNRS